MWNLKSSNVFDDGSISISAFHDDGRKALLEARPTDGGYTVHKFNIETGVMDHFFDLQCEGTLSPDRILFNCENYLNNGVPKNLHVLHVDMENRVVCDYCNDDFTNSDECGGFLFGSYATCPKCAPRILKDATKYDELNRITKTCPDGMSFREFVLTQLR